LRTLEWPQLSFIDIAIAICDHRPFDILAAFVPLRQVESSNGVGVPVVVELLIIDPLILKKNPDKARRAQAEWVEPAKHAGGAYEKVLKPGQRTRSGLAA
ncbi:hypothetical protein B0A49_13653, partial [Cryomyces minteri]